MKKLQAKEQKLIIGGSKPGICKLELCAYTLVPGATYAGPCPIPNNCSVGGYLYIITTNTGAAGCLEPPSAIYCTI